jgi:hypothetical protein
VTEPTAGELLDDVRRLKLQARADRHAYAAPLLLFGVLILLAPLSYPSEFNRASPSTVTVYWAASVIGGFLATIWWYRYRGTRAGLMTAISGYSTAAVIGGLGVGVGLPSLAALGQAASLSFYSTPWITLPALAFTTIAALTPLWWGSKMTVPGAKFTTMAAAIGFAIADFALVANYFTYRSSGVPLFIIALGFFVLSWLERSPLLAGISTMFFAGVLLANLYNMENMFSLAGLYDTTYTGERQSAFANFLLPGLILVVGGVVTLSRGRRRRV